MREIFYLMTIAKTYLRYALKTTNQDKLHYVTHVRGTSILGEVRNVEISGPTQQLLCSKYHGFLAVFALAHPKINQIA